ERAASATPSHNSFPPSLTPICTTPIGTVTKLAFKRGIRPRQVWIRARFCRQSVPPLRKVVRRRHGLVRPRWHFRGQLYQPRPTASFCEMESEMELSGCDILVDCFDSNDNVHDWSTCMENEVHAAIHGMIGGGWNCAVNMEIFRSTHPEYSRGLLSYTLEYVVALTWPTNALMSDYNDCDTGCTVGEMEQTCGCTCTTDFNTWSDDAVYDFMERSMIMMESMIH
ncbi:unnamed protein product, partial [Ectocarpus fasciculatus]